MTHKVILLGQMRLYKSLLTVAQGIFGTQSNADQRASCSLLSFPFLLSFSCSPSPFLLSFPLSWPCLMLEVEPLCAYKVSAVPLSQSTQDWYRATDLKELPEFVIILHTSVI